MTTITQITAREVLDSRGNPTVEATVSSDNLSCSAMVPSGASTGSQEALELRDGDERYNGKGVLTAVLNIQTKIAPALRGQEVTAQATIDQLMLELDGTHNKANLGANAILAVSLATARLAARVSAQPLYRYINTLYGQAFQQRIPIPLFNIINGGAHADNNLAIQEFMIMPIGAENYPEALRMGVEVFQALKAQLKQDGYSTAVGDEGGFAPNFSHHAMALDYITQAIESIGLTPGKEIVLALDVAANELYNGGYYNLPAEKLRLTAVEFIEYLDTLAHNYPIYSIEDGMAESDHIGWQQLTRSLGAELQLVGDDVFVTNPKLLKAGIQDGIANAILIKVNQIGTLTETLQTITIARAANYTTVISHRSGETEDSFIADLAVGTNSPQIKAGSLSRSERLAKYNQLLRINEELICAQL